MATSFKAQAIANQLADLLKARGLGSLGLVQSFDTDQNPLISIGSGAAGSANFIIKVTPVILPDSQDVLGNASIAYSPHVIQLCTEADPAAGAGADPTTRQQLLNVLGQIGRMGARQEWYESASGVAPSAAALIAGNLKASFEPDPYWPMIGNQ